MRVRYSGEVEVEPLGGAGCAVEVRGETFRAGLQARALILKQRTIALEALTLVLTVTQ